MTEASVPVWMVRHGKSAQGFDEAENAGLSDIGREQAEVVARHLAAHLAPCDIVTSPMSRAQQTAQPLADLWRSSPLVVAAVDEIPPPRWMCGVAIGHRRAWLNEVLTARYGDLGMEVETWRLGVLAYVSSLRRPTVIFTHYLTINAVIGAATRDLRVAPSDPGYCSVAEFLVTGNHLRLRDG